MVSPDEYKAMLGKPKRTNRRDEDKLCMAFTKHCEIYFPRTPSVLNWTHIANEGRSPQEGDKLKKMGVNAGWFDYIFEAPNLTIHLEAKIEGKDYSESQKTFHYFMKDMPGKKLAKFHSVKGGHLLLIAMGIYPIMPCSIFNEADYLTKPQKFERAIDFYKP